MERIHGQSLLPLIQALPRPIEEVVKLVAATFPSLSALTTHTQQGIG